MELDYNPSRALVRVLLASLDDPSKEMYSALLNPNSLQIDVDVAVGELHPVGASQTTLQYGHTKSVDNSLEFYFSDQLQGRYVDPTYGTTILPVNITQYVNWIASFCYADEAGRAPSPLLIFWNNVMSIAVVVKRFRAEYVRFARDLTPKAARVTIDYAELRYTFKTSASQMKSGWYKRDPLLKKGQTGASLNLKSKGNT